MKLLKPAIIQKMSCVYNKDVKYDKNQFILFFSEKSVSKPVSSQRIHRKYKNFCPNPF